MQHTYVCPALSLLLHMCRTHCPDCLNCMADACRCADLYLCITFMHQLTALLQVQGAPNCERARLTAQAAQQQRRTCCTSTMLACSVPHKEAQHTPPLVFHTSLPSCIAFSFLSGIPRSATEDGGLCTRTGTQCGLCGSSHSGVPVWPREQAVLLPRAEPSPSGTAISQPPSLLQLSTHTVNTLLPRAAGLMSYYCQACLIW